MNWKNSYRAMKKSAISYNLLYTLPVAIVTSALVACAVVFNLGLIFFVSFLLLALVFTGFVAFYPVMNSYVRNQQINNLMPLVVTHLAVLSTSAMSKDQIVDEILDRSEYGPAVEEFKVVSDLTKNLNVSFADACRIQSKRTASQTMSDFFDRLANSTDAGEQFSVFLNNEQTSIFQTYEVSYTASISALDMTKEVYISMIAAVLFMLIMMCVIPFIQGAPITLYAALAIIAFLVTLLALVFGIRTILPGDPLWVRNKKKTHVDRRVRLYSAVSIPLCFVVFFVLFLFVTFIPVQIDVAAALTPLTLCGYYARKEQAKVKNRDENYPTFIRAIGSTAGMVRMMDEAVDKLSEHEFGNLSETIRDLNKRLKSKVKALEDPWHTFGRETGSFLIYEFTHMFASAVEAGGDVAQGSMMINNNFLRILGMRKKRYQSAAGYRWVVYGVAASVGLVFSIAFSVIFMMQSLYGIVSGFSVQYLGGLFSASSPLTEMAIPMISVLIITSYSIAGAFVVKDAESGRDATMGTDIAGIAWVLAISWIIGDLMMRWATAGL
jgi:flagellar protein FlaJ